jgi:hypothetical protein
MYLFCCIITNVELSTLQKFELVVGQKKIYWLVAKGVLFKRDGCALALVAVIYSGNATDLWLYFSAL